MKTYKWQLLLSSLLVLAPAAVGAVFWNELPSLMPSHATLTGEADAFAPKAFVVFGIPLILLAIHWLGIVITLKDSKMKQQNPKVVSIVLWILPALSVFVAGLTYSIAAGQVLSAYRLLPLFLGVLFIAIGNYLPKCTQNFYLGIRLKWTLLSERNWTATHRYGGKVWTAGGAAILVTAALPMTLGMILLFGITAVMVILPTVFSYRLFRMQVEKGELDANAKVPMTKGQKKMGVFALVMTGILLVAVTIVMFTGSISAECRENDVTVKASFYHDLTIDYDSISCVNYFENFDVGARVLGFGSARLQMGTFQNDEIGRYTLYAYTGCDAYAMITVVGDIFVIGLDDKAETRQLYETLVQKTS